GRALEALRERAGRMVRAVIAPEGRPSVEGPQGVHESRGRSRIRPGPGGHEKSVSRPRPLDTRRQRMFGKWLSRSVGRKGGRTRRGRSPRRPGRRIPPPVVLEVLEARTLPSFVAPALTDLGAADIAADVNGDGIPDLIAAGGGSLVSVALGNGDGT